MPQTGSIDPAAGAPCSWPCSRSCVLGPTSQAASRGSPQGAAKVCRCASKPVRGARLALALGPTAKSLPQQQPSSTEPSPRRYSTAGLQPHGHEYPARSEVGLVSRTDSCINGLLRYRLGILPGSIYGAISVRPAQQAQVLLATAARAEPMGLPVAHTAD